MPSCAGRDVIEAGSAVGDIMHVSDLYTTLARIAGAEEYIPTDRVIDGIDQTSLWLLGEHQGRRDYVLPWSGKPGHPPPLTR